MTMDHANRGFEVGIITPIKNEKRNLPDLFDSVLSQSIRPSSWVIVDNGSEDGSSEIIDDKREGHSWIDKTTYESEEYDLGVNISKVIQHGYNHLNEEMDFDGDYYMILDGDMKLTPSYLEELLECFHENSKFGIISGGIYIQEGDRLVLEKRGENEPAGGATIVKGEFLRELGGIPLVPCWDSALKAKTKNRNYLCEYKTDIEAKAVQSRRTGAGDDLFWGAHKKGRMNYILNLHPIVALLKSTNLMVNKRILMGVGFSTGYLTSFMIRDEKVQDEELRRYFWNEKRDAVVERILKHNGWLC